MKVIRFVLIALVILFVANVTITSGIDRFKHPDMSDTRLFIRIPQTFFWDFE